MATEFVTGLVLAAGGSSRLGRPKQLLPYRGTTLLDWVLSTARDARLAQRVVALGGYAAEVRGTVDLEGFDVVVNDDFGTGCSSSIAAALQVVDPRADALVLLLGDQPSVTARDVDALVRARGDAPLAVCRYADGRGHPFAFGRSVFGDLAQLHGDKGVWKLLDRAGDAVGEVPLPGVVPRDVDTWTDYEAVLAG
jgi:molybdenum cofactor cytidylyltransferase